MCDMTGQEKNAIECLNSFYEKDEMYEPAQVAINAIKNIQKYRDLEKRLFDMFGGEVDLKWCVDEMEDALVEPDNSHPMNAKILTYEDAAMWTAYKAIGTPEECQKATEKQKGKKPVFMKPTDKLLNGYCVCPVCKSVVSVDDYSQNYCGSCGQKIDWGDKR